MGATGFHHTLIELFDLPHGRARREGDGHEDGLRDSPHGGDVTEIGHRGLVPDIPKRSGAQIEMDVLGEEIGGQEQTDIAREVQDGGIVTDAASHCLMGTGESTSETPDEGEFSAHR